MNYFWQYIAEMDKINQDVVNEKCVRNDAGELSLSDEEKMKASVGHYAWLLNVEFEWESDLLPEVAPVEGPPPPVTKDLICKALRKMKCGKAAGPSGIIAEMLKAAGEVGIELLTELTEVVFCNSVIPTDWQESFILNLYKGKGDALERGNYCGLKLADQVMKLLERVLDSFIERWWTLTPCSLALCRVVGLAPLMPSSSSANCQRSTRDDPKVLIFTL